MEVSKQKKWGGGSVVGDGRKYICLYDLYIMHIIYITFVASKFPPIGL